MIVLLRGGGDLASGVAYRLHRAGLPVVITEIAQPLMVRRTVSFGEAVYRGVTVVEGVTARLVGGSPALGAAFTAGEIPVLVDPDASILNLLHPAILVDARMTKRAPDLGLDAAALVIGLGPGFSAGQNCHAVIETNRGHYLGRVIWDGSPQPDTGLPDEVKDRQEERVLRAPVDGILIGKAQIGDLLEPGQPVAEISGQMILAPFRGVLRGLIHPGIAVRRGLKIGDLDPRADSRYIQYLSDKSLAVGGGVLEAILTRPEIRLRLWQAHGAE